MHAPKRRRESLRNRASMGLAGWLAATKEESPGKKRGQKGERPSMWSPLRRLGALSGRLLETQEIGRMPNLDAEKSRHILYCMLRTRLYDGRLLSFLVDVKGERGPWFWSTPCSASAATSAPASTTIDAPSRVIASGLRAAATPHAALLVLLRLAHLIDDLVGHAKIFDLAESSASGPRLVRAGKGKERLGGAGTGSHVVSLDVGFLQPHKLVALLVMGLSVKLPRGLNHERNGARFVSGGAEAFGVQASGSAYGTRLDHFSERQVHPSVAHDQVSVERLPVLQLDQHGMALGRVQQAEGQLQREVSIAVGLRHIALGTAGASFRATRDVVRGRDGRRAGGSLARQTIARFQTNTIAARWRRKGQRGEDRMGIERGGCHEETEKDSISPAFTEGGSEELAQTADLAAGGVGRANAARE